jgi:hypothetical protein
MALRQGEVGTPVADLSLDKTILQEALRKNGAPEAAKKG